MGFRWRKSISIFPGFRLNLSHRGVRGQIGASPLSFSFPIAGGSKQRRVTATLPGTGLSFVSQSTSAGSRTDLAAEKPSLVPDTPRNPAISDDTRRILDRYLALSVKKVSTDAEGFRYAFDLHCKECGGYQLKSPEGELDHHVAFCAACGIKMGMLGEIRAYAAEAAERHRQELPSLPDATPSPRRAKGLMWLAAVSSVAAAIIFWPAAKQPVAVPVATVSSAVPKVPAETAPVPEPPPLQAKPELVTAPLPPRRPKGI